MHSTPKPQPWPIADLKPHPDVKNLVNTLTKCFFPKEPLLGLIASELERRGVAPQESARIAKSAFEAAIGHLLATDIAWRSRLDAIFDEKYPSIPREYWQSGRIAQRSYERLLAASDSPPTFEVDHFAAIPSPRNLLAAKIAPALFVIEEVRGKSIVKPTANVERFINGEKKAVRRSSLFEVSVFTRPVWRLHDDHWSPYSRRHLPRRTIVARVLCATATPSLIADFVHDLRTTFSWMNDAALAVYLGYLIQPMLAHLYVGQMPAYCFLGPTKAGKGYLSNALPSIIYCRVGDSTVLTKQITPNSYEMEVLLNSGKDALYVCFDEIKSATDDELKMLDALCTQTTLLVRKFRTGYIEIDNHFTLSMTAVNRTFTDETYGRLAVIKLKESRPDKISIFHNQWSKRGPELLRAIWDSINAVDIDIPQLPRIPDRRPGFGLMSHVVKRAFGIEPDYKVESSNIDVLDDVCRMAEEGHMIGRTIGSWRQFSLRSFTEFMDQKHEIKWKRANALASINTALGYTSTRNHPSYRESGYQAESGNFYEIELREEGQKAKRSFIYVRKVSGKSESRSQELTQLPDHLQQIDCQSNDRKSV